MSQADRKKVLLPEEQKDLLERIPEWEVKLDGLQRTFEFTDFEEAFNFMTKVAVIAEEINHHPDWSNSWNKVDITVTNHQAGGVTKIDFVLCERINRLVRQ
tara:strand:- start:177 stop:479 length:303 start_codon:yes stop_codon:yes gene_type:complete